MIVLHGTVSMYLQIPLTATTSKTGNIAIRTEQQISVFQEELLSRWNYCLIGL